MAEIISLTYEPAKFATEHLLFRTDQTLLYRNVGTFDTPNFQIVGGSIDSGMISMWGGEDAEIPTGWLRCDGAGYDTGVESELFAAIGYTWGGAGATFNVPDFESSNRFISAASTDGEVAGLGGLDTVILTTAQLPSHTHTYNVSGFSSTSAYGANSSSNAGSNSGSTTGAAGSGSSHENKPPYARCYFIIKQ